MKKKTRPRKKVTKKSLQVKSKKSGFIHHIEDFGKIEKVADSILKKFALDNRLQLAQSIKFYEAIQRISLDKKFLTSFPQLKSYRICFGGLEPLSIAGNLACGGRFNVGGAQKTSDPFPFEMFACIYTASSLDCAKAETGLHKNSEIYEVSLLNPVELWDVRALLAATENADGFISAVEQSPFNMQWCLQKFPTPSQILGATLRNIGGEGIVYPSTKHKDSFVYGFFVKDDADAILRLKATRATDNQGDPPG